MILKSLNIPKSYNKSISNQIKKPRGKVSESHNRFPDSVILKMPPGTIGVDDSFFDRDD